MNTVTKASVYLENRIKWLGSFASSFKITDKPAILNLDSDKCVALIPHADDELIGLGTLLSRNTKIKLIYFGYLGSDCSEYNRNIRFSEFRKYCDSVGAEFTLFNDKSRIEIEKANVIILPSLVDWHSDHRELNFILRNILSKNDKPQIIWYTISVFCSSMFNARFVLETKRDLSIKYRLFTDIYISQKNLPRSRFKIKERIYGKNINSYAAEKFYYINYDLWIKVVDAFNEIVSSDELASLKENINDFDSIDKISSQIYKNIYTYQYKI